MLAWHQLHLRKLIVLLLGNPIYPGLFLYFQYVFHQVFLVMQ
jgi:hypothetical protein